MTKTMINGVEKRSDVNAKGALSLKTALQEAAVLLPSFLFLFLLSNDVLTVPSYRC